MNKILKYLTECVNTSLFPHLIVLLSNFHSIVILQMTFSENKKLYYEGHCSVFPLGLPWSICCPCLTKSSPSSTPYYGYSSCHHTAGSAYSWTSQPAGSVAPGRPDCNFLWCKLWMVRSCEKSSCHERASWTTSLYHDHNIERSDSRRVDKYQEILLVKQVRLRVGSLTIWWSYHPTN